MQTKLPNSDDFGLRSSVIQAPFKKKSATSIVARVCIPNKSYGRGANRFYLLRVLLENISTTHEKYSTRYTQEMESRGY